MNDKIRSRQGSILQFLIPSFIGVFLFMIPLPYDGSVTIPVAILANQLQGWLAPFLPMIATIFTAIAMLGSLYTMMTSPQSELIRKLFAVSGLWFLIRIIGFIFALFTLLQIGPEWLWSDITGGLLLHDLIPVLISVFLFAGLFLPLLLNFGLLELCGALLTPLMRPLFTLPGRSSIDCIASWMGDGTIGVLLTNQQYEQGYYSKREAAVIGTTFSVVSITFSIVIMQEMGLNHLFLPYYLTILIAGFVAALVMPRIPPLSKKRSDFIQEKPKTADDEKPAQMSNFMWGINEAAKKASRNKLSAIFKDGIKNVLDMWIGVIPTVMALGTLAVIIAEFTPLFMWLGTPFVPLLEIMQVPFASEASQTMVIGFADMFLPAVIGSGIESEMTRFIIACLSVTQLIYMSEVGGLLLASKLPVTFIDLVIIFLERTLISLPIIVLCAHMIF